MSSLNFNLDELKDPFQNPTSNDLAYRDPQHRRPKFNQSLPLSTVATNTPIPGAVLGRDDSGSEAAGNIPYHTDPWSNPLSQQSRPGDKPAIESPHTSSMGSSISPSERSGSAHPPMKLSSQSWNSTTPIRSPTDKFNRRKKLQTLRNEDSPLTEITQEPTCKNCSTRTISRRRRDPFGARLCNVCAIFVKLHGRMRPLDRRAKQLKAEGQVSSKTRLDMHVRPRHWQKQEKSSDLDSQANSATTPPTSRAGPSCSPGGDITLSPAEVASPKDTHDGYNSMNLEPLKPFSKLDTNSSTPFTCSDEGVSHVAETKDISDGVKDYIIDKLVEKAYDLLGYNLSDVSEGRSSPGSSSDEYVEEGSKKSIASHSDYSGTAELNSSPKDASSSQDVSQGRSTDSVEQTSCSTHGTLSKSAGKSKRGSNGDEGDGEDREKENKRRRNLKPCTGSQRVPRFACPFYKKSPEIHGRNASCLWPGFRTISRLKEHLYRVHMSNVEVDNLCPRCRQTFQSASDLVRHLARADRCVQVAVPQQEDGLDEGQVQKLRSRDRGVVPEDKWRYIYRTCHRLLDDAETPSPYCDQESPADQAVEGYDWYRRQNLPGLIRQQLEQEPDITEFVERFGERLPAIIRACQDNLHQRFISPRESADSAGGEGLSAENDQSTVPPPDNRAATPAPYHHPGALPVAFEAAPNTDDGMTSSEALQVHMLSSRRGNRNSDSGYGSGVFEAHPSGPVCEQDHSGPKPAPSRDVPQPGVFPRHYQFPKGVEDSVQDSGVQSSGQIRWLDQVDGSQMLDRSLGQPASGLSRGGQDSIPPKDSSERYFMLIQVEEHQGVMFSCLSPKDKCSTSESSTHHSPRPQANVLSHYT